MIKLTVLYGHPKDPEAFENYYENNHMPLVDKIEGLQESELTKFVGSPDGSPAAYYRMAELYFNNEAEMQEAMGSEAGKTTAADLANFATGGVTLLVGVTP